MNEPGPVVRPTILIVDDTPDNLTLLTELLKVLYRVKAARSGERALQIATSDDPPDLILLDVMMPGLSGFDVCKRLREQPRTRNIPVIFVTTRGATEDEIQGFELGAVDYITKPINPPTVLMRVDNQLRIKAAADFLRDQNDYLEREVQRRTQEVAAIQDVTIQAVTSLAETRDNETGNHIRRTQHYVGALADHLQHHPRFAATLDEETRRLLFKSAPLHDIGKVGIPDRILLKPGKLTPEEFETMKTHTSLGLEALQKAEERLGMDVPFLRLAKEIVYSHHEKWDGSGYPQGLRAEAIPLSARLMAVADVYDALISRRVYKTGIPHEDAVQHIQAQRGRHFDPEVVDAFVAIQEIFAQIAQRFQDDAQNPTA